MSKKTLTSTPTRRKQKPFPMKHSVLFHASNLLMITRGNHSFVLTKGVCTSHISTSVKLIVSQAKSVATQPRMVCKKCFEIPIPMVFGAIQTQRAPVLRRALPRSRVTLSCGSPLPTPVQIGRLPTGTSREKDSPDHARCLTRSGDHEGFETRDLHALCRLFSSVAWKRSASRSS